MTDFQFILASQSPRRADLLGRYGLRFDVRPADIDESRQPGEKPDTFVLRLAREKAAAVGGAGLPVLGADTVVVLDQDVLGKPLDRADAINMLTRLSGCTHQVLTAVCVCDRQRSETVLSCTEVQFAPLTAEQIAAYWASGESAGKAGAYAIQGLAEAFVSEIRGNYSGVVGLPLQPSLGLLKLFGVEPPVWSVNE